MNNLFSGKKEEVDGDSGDEEAAYLSRLTAKERKTQKKKHGRDRDKITTKDARVLIGGRTVADHSELSKLPHQGVNDRSKTIKKGGKRGGNSHEITKEQVRAKLAKARVAVSTYRINK